VENVECRECGVWKMWSVENVECRKCGVIENAGCRKCGEKYKKIKKHPI